MPLALLIAVLFAGHASAFKMHVVFSAECTHLFDWHSVGIFYSFHASNFSQTANITRLLACSEAEQAKYHSDNLHIGPTFIHRNLRNDPMVDEVDYPSYNKPYSVMAWLAGRDNSTRGTGHTGTACSARKNHNIKNKTCNFRRGVKLPIGDP